MSFTSGCRALIPGWDLHACVTKCSVVSSTIVDCHHKHGSCKRGKEKGGGKGREGKQQQQQHQQRRKGREMNGREMTPWASICHSAIINLYNISTHACNLCKLLPSHLMMVHVILCGYKWYYWDLGTCGSAGVLLDLCRIQQNVMNCGDPPGCVIPEI